MSIVFIGSNYETFTPTQSGALSTIMYGCCQAALAQGVQPWVVAVKSEASPYDWANSILISKPKIPQSGPRWWLARAERKVLGWTHPGQRELANRMANAIAGKNLQNLPFVLLNNPETAILLRQKFPQARIYHWFQNQLEAKERVRRQLPAAINGAFGVSDFTTHWLKGYYDFAGKEVLTVPNATDSAHFTNTPREHRDVPVINFVGRTGREKAPDLLLRAALKLTEESNRFKIQIVGSNHWDRFEMDDYQRELKGLAQQLQERGIEVMWTGHIGRERLPEVLRQADINVVPSRWDEPFGMVTLEGMACGLATVASNTGGTPEVCGDAALLFERDNVEELTAHLKRLVADASLRSHYAKLGREQAQRFSWHRTWQTLRTHLDIR